ncbi:MAG: histidine--tRNA ligase [Clostridia bacterium]
MLTQAPKGTQDILPEDSYFWQAAEQIMREVCDLFGYREVRTPIFEHTELFQRSVGDTTDVVQKEMYTFLDKGARSVTLKPEGTAGVARAFLEGKLFAGPLPLKMYYVNCPCFRYEKPQAGRLREFHQNGIEVFGAKDASCDAEVITLALELVKRCGIKDLCLSINSIGCPDCRKKYFELLTEFLEPKVEQLCPDCKGRFARNPLRILDCKEEKCQHAIEGAPSMLAHLCPDCQAHFDQLQQYLSALGVEYALDSRIVRGLDYYTKTVFEVIARTPGGNLTVCGGGRYDGLVEELGGPSTPGIGFGMGLERLLMVQKAQGAAPEVPCLYEVFVCTLGARARLEGVKLVSELRGAGIKADLDHAARSLKAQFKYADKTGAPRVIVLADDELQRGVVKLRDMRESAEREIARDELIQFLKK